MDLVDEHDGPASRRPPETLGRGHDVADFLDAGEDRAEGDEPRPGCLGDDAGDRGLARTGRTPQDDRLEQVALDRLAEWLAGREQFVLADELVERPRPHTLGQRRRSARRWFFAVRKERIHVTHCAGETLDTGSTRR
jgi:hypothetical protein